MIYINMKISVWPDHLPNNAPEIYKQVCEYISQTDEIVEASLDADAALIWSVLWNGRMQGNKKVWDHYRAQNKNVIVIEVGGLVRNTTWRLSANGVNGSAIFPYVKELNHNRPKMFNLNISPWHDGDLILICGQHGKSEQWQNMPPMSEYFEQTVLKIRQLSNNPILIRPHPRFPAALDTDFCKHYNVQINIAKKLPQTYDNFDLEQLLAQCYCVVSHTGNSGITSIITGTPAIVNKDSLAYSVSSNIEELNNLNKPDREQWLVDLCHKEWLTCELEQAWKGLRSKL